MASDIPNRPDLAPPSAEPIGDDPRVAASWEGSTLHLVIEGKITPEHLTVLAWTLTRTANKLMDAAEAHAQQTAPPRIVPVHGQLRRD